MKSDPAPTIRLLIIEDHCSIREVLVQALNATPGFTVVGQATSASEGLAAGRELQPDVVILDAMLPDDPGLEMIADLRSLVPEAAVLVYSGNRHRSLVSRALLHGARGFVDKSADFADFITAIRRVHLGLTFFSPRIAEVVRDIVVAPPSGNAAEMLSDMERAILARLARGLSSKQIAQELQRSPFTIDNHRRKIMRKTGHHSVAELTIHAIRIGLRPDIQLVQP